MSKAKIAVIGTGWWATTAHLPALKENPRAEIVLVDKNPQALKAAGEKYGVAAQYTRLTDALTDHKDIIGAVIAVPHAMHHAVAKEALEHGLHLLLEKPMTLYAWEAKDLVDLAEAKNRRILMGYTFPYLDPMRQAKKWVDEGLLGEIEYITCSMSSMTIEFLRGKPEEYRQVMGYPVTGPSDATYSDPTVAGGGQAHLQITHSAAMMFHFTERQNLRAEVVSAFMGKLDARVDVVDAFAVRMTNGAVATVGSTGNIGKGDGGIVEVHLHGSRGRLLADAISGGVHLRLHDGREEKIAPTFPAYPGRVPIQKFIEMLLDGAENPFPGRTNGLYTVELLDAAYRSAAQDGMPVKVASLYA
ncbi:MAG: Gfo/Idh/MocA family oxidoreductase [Anaerolineae bacterium]|nr:Gfo/Idh/MocA family oxidoreductase [Anaerolineae bacterium]